MKDRSLLHSSLAARFARTRLPLRGTLRSPNWWCTLADPAPGSQARASLASVVSPTMHFVTAVVALPDGHSKLTVAPSPRPP